jgi:hypothetical protein
VATLTLTIGASSDDAYQGGFQNTATRGDTSSATMFLTGLSSESPANPQVVGSHGSNDAAAAGFRFTGVTIPQGTTITSAVLTLTPSATYSSPGVIAINIGCQAADNPTTFTSSPGNLNTTARPRTTAFTGPTSIKSVTAGTAINFTITSAVQEVINRAGFASGNAIVVIADNNGTTTTAGEWQDFYSFDVSGVTTVQKPTLTIVYSTGGGTQALVGSASSASSASGALTQTGHAPQALTGSASSASSASAILTITPPAAQNLVGSASSASSASAVLSAGVVAQNLVGSASSASSASAVLTITPAAPQSLVGAASSASSAAAAITLAAQAAQNLVGSAASASSASGALTQTPSSTVQHLVGSASSASSASGVLTNGVAEVANFQIGTNNAGTGMNDMAPAAVRDSSNRLWRAAATTGTNFDNGSGTYNGNTLRMFKCNTTGVPSAFTEQDSAHRPTNVGSFSIAIDGSDLIHVAFVHAYAATTTGIYYTTFNTSTNLWSGVETKIGVVNFSSATAANQNGYIFGDAGVSLNLDSSGVPHVVMYGQATGVGTSGNTHIFYTNRIGGTWSAALQLDTATLSGTVRCMHPMAMFDSTGALHVAWMTIDANYQATSQSAYYIKRSAAGTWGSVTTFGDALLGSVDNGPSLYVSEDDHVHIAYGLSDGAFATGETVTGTTVNNKVFYRFSSDGGATWNTTTQPPHYVAHDFSLGPSGDGAGGIRIYSHSQPTTVDGLGTAIGYMQLPKGGSWAAWHQIAIDTNGNGYDCTTSPRRAQYFNNLTKYLDVAYFDLNLPASAMLSSDPSGAVPMHGSASSASSASGVLTMTPAAAQSLLGAASVASSASGILTQTPAAAQPLTGSASSASSASAVLTMVPAPAQNLVGSASSQSSASGVLTQTTPPGDLLGSASSASSASAILTITPQSPQSLVGSASSASSASAALTQTPPGGLVGSARSSSSASAVLTITPPSVPPLLLVGSASSSSSASAILTNGTSVTPVVLRGKENVLTTLDAQENVLTVLRVVEMII